MEIKFENAFESVILFNTNKEIISKKEEFDISINRNIGFIEDYFNFTNNDISIHILKKKFEMSNYIKSEDIEEINNLANKIVDNFEKLDLKKFTIPVTTETIAKSIEENIFFNLEKEDKTNKETKRKNLYLLLLILFNKDKIKTKLLEDYKILLLLNKVKIPANIEVFMKKENFYENYYNPFAKLLSDFYVKNELIAFYVKLINLYFTKTVIKESDISIIDNYHVATKVFVEKSLVKLTGMIAKKVSSYIAPCIKNIISINPLGVTLSIAVLIA